MPIGSDVGLVNLAFTKIGEKQIQQMSDRSDINLTNIYNSIRRGLLSQYYWNFARRRVTISKKTYTATTIGFTTTPTITDSGALFISSGGFMSGDRVKATGSASNDGTYTAITAAAGALTLDSDDDELTTEGAGASVTLERKPAFGFEYSFDVPSDFLGSPKITDDPAFKLEGGGNGLQQRLYCDLEEIELVYTADITDETSFTEHFESCLVILLASRLAMTITRDSALSNSLLLEFKNVFLDSCATEASSDNYNESRADTSWQTR